jgi:hypothetical protein
MVKPQNSKTTSFGAIPGYALSFSQQHLGVHPLQYGMDVSNGAPTESHGFCWIAASILEHGKKAGEVLEMLDSP